MTVAACFISRAGGGLAFTGARWFDLKGRSAWRGVTAEKAVEDPARSSEQLGAWLIAQCAASPGKPEIVLVLDADGSACSWMSAESGEPEDVRAAVRDALSESEDDGGASLAWMGTWVGPAEAGVATSVQGLTDVAIRSEQAKGGKRGDAGPKRRMGVMSVPDLPVRLLLDQLDKAGVRVRRVSTVWHVLAMASSPAGKTSAVGSNARAGLKGLDTQDSRIVADSEPDAHMTVASVIIDDEPGASLTAGGGQLLWCWSQGGALVCAGSMRLRESVDRGSDPSPRIGKSAGLRLVGPDGATDTADETPSPTAARVIEVTRGDIGRLLTDWLGWSVQTGQTPTRILVAGPASVTCSGLDFDLPEMLGVAAVGAGLGKAWPGTEVGASAQDDPIATAMQRVVDAENDGEPLAAGPVAVDPRLSVTTLSTRPGRASRTLHLWGGLALMAAAAGIGVLGWRIGRSADDLAAGVAKVQSDRAAIMEKARKDLKLVIPADAADPVAIIQQKINELNTQRREMRAEDPLLAEVTRFLKSAHGVPGIELRSVSMTSAGLLATAELLVKDDAGPTFLDRLRSSRTGLGRELRWDGRTVGVDGERRRFNLSGKFEDAAKGPAVDPPVLPPLPAAGSDAGEHAAPDAAKPATTSIPTPPAQNDKGADPKSAEPVTPAQAEPEQPAPEGKP